MDLLAPSTAFIAEDKIPIKYWTTLVKKQV